MLTGRVALVAGATRSAGRAIAVELGALGATVYATGRSSRLGRSDLDRPETIEETADLVDAVGGRGVPVRVDHSDPVAVARLVARIEDEVGRLDILVNDVWGGDGLTDWERPLWEQSLDDGLLMVRRGVETHLVTSHAALRLLSRRRGGLVVEVTDGAHDGGGAYRGSFFYDLVKASVIRLAVAQAAELARFGSTAVSVSPGWLRSERMLDRYGVTEATWREATAREPHFCCSESPYFLGGGGWLRWPLILLPAGSPVGHCPASTSPASTA